MKLFLRYFSNEFEIHAGFNFEYLVEKSLFQMQLYQASVTPIRKSAEAMLKNITGIYL